MSFLLCLALTQLRKCGSTVFLRHYHKQKNISAGRSVLDSLSPQIWSLCSPFSYSVCGTEAQPLQDDVLWDSLPTHIGHEHAPAHLISSGHVHAAKLHPPEICIILRQLRALVLWRTPMLSFTAKSYRFEWERSSFPACFWSLQNFV